MRKAEFITQKTSSTEFISLIPSVKVSRALGRTTQGALSVLRTGFSLPGAGEIQPKSEQFSTHRPNSAPRDVPGAEREGAGGDGNKIMKSQFLNEPRSPAKALSFTHLRNHPPEQDGPVNGGVPVLRREEGSGTLGKASGSDGEGGTQCRELDSDFPSRIKSLELSKMSQSEVPGQSSELPGPCCFPVNSEFDVMLDNKKLHITSVCYLACSVIALLH